MKLGQAVEAQLEKDAAATRPSSAAPATAQGMSARRSDSIGVRPIYRPDVFDVQDLNDAKKIILTSEKGTTSKERWELETPYVVAEIGRQLEIDDSSVVLDYGCGIGRLSKGLIESYGCSVIGVDISPSMREHAQQYVRSDRFVACAPQTLDMMIARGFRVTHAVAIWVIQHCEKPDLDVARIEAALAPRGRLYVLNLHVRAIPSDRGWISDNVSVEQLLARRFETVAVGQLPESVTTPEIARAAFTMTLRKRT